MPWTDGRWMIECPKCKGKGCSYCPTCGQEDTECDNCGGTGEIAAPEPSACKA